MISIDRNLFGQMKSSLFAKELMGTGLLELTVTKLNVHVKNILFNQNKDKN